MPLESKTGTKPTIYFTAVVSVFKGEPVIDVFTSC